MKSTKIIIAVILGLCFVLAATAVGISYYQTKKPEKTVSVVGLAEKDFTSDLIVWNLRYDATAADMKDAYSSLKEKNKIVKEFLKSQGITDSEMDFMNITTERQYEYEWDNVNRRSVEIFRGYNSEQRVRIESKDVDKIEKAIRAIAQLYDQNIQINSDSPEYYYTKLGDLNMEMLSQASKNARGGSHQQCRKQTGGLEVGHHGRVPDYGAQLFRGQLLMGWGVQHLLQTETCEHQYAAHLLCEIEVAQNRNLSGFWKKLRKRVPKSFQFFRIKSKKAVFLWLKS